MANVQHSTLTGADLHEPKGVGSASTNTVYVANGSGSGTWQKIAANQINTTSINNLNKIVITTTFDDISTAHSHWVTAPIAGNIEKIYSVLHQSIATGDTTLTFKIGGVNVTNGVITITQSGSAAGDIDSATPTGANTVTAGQAIEIASDGGTNTSNAIVTLTIVLDVS
jgi:hypothetical protein